MIEYMDPRPGVQNLEIGNLRRKEKELLRGLARRVAKIASEPAEEKKRLWKKHNSLERVRPMVLAFPEGSWQELLPYEETFITDPFWAGYEWYLRRLIYRGEKIRDDNVIEPVVEVPLVYSYSGWGLGDGRIRSSGKRGAVAWEPVLRDFSDVEKMKYPTISIDEKTTRRNVNAVGEVLGDILEVREYRSIFIDSSLVGVLTRMRGINQLMIDMMDNPDWLHKVLSFMQEGTMKLLDYVERNIDFDLNNGNDYVGTGGIGYTDELPAPGFANRKTLLKDLWGTAESQDFDIISPAMYDEFAVQYQKPILERYGLSCYGCCESLNRKFDIVKKISNLRRVSVSPWTDPAIAAEKLEDKYILSWKPSPVQLIGGFDKETASRQISDTLRKTRGCVVEIIMKDTHTVENHPERIEQWVDVAKSIAENGYL